MRIRLGSSPSLTQYRTKSKRSRSARTQQKNWPHALSLAYARRRRPPDHPRSGTLTPVTDVDKRHVTTPPSPGRTEEVLAGERRHSHQFCNKRTISLLGLYDNN